MKSGENLSEDTYELKLDPQREGIDTSDKSLDPKPTDGSNSNDSQKLQNKKIKLSSEDKIIGNLERNEDRRENAPPSSTSTTSSHGEVGILNYADKRPQHPDAQNEAVRSIFLQIFFI